MSDGPPSTTLGTISVYGSGPVSNSALTQELGEGIKRAPDDNGIQLAELPRNRRGPTALYRANRFDRIGRAHNIEHRLTKPNHAWTSGQVERMNRTLKEATVKHCHFDSHDQLRDHFAAFLNAYNFARLPM